MFYQLSCIHFPSIPDEDVTNQARLQLGFLYLLCLAPRFPLLLLMFEFPVSVQKVQWLPRVEKRKSVFESAPEPLLIRLKQFPVEHWRSPVRVEQHRLQCLPGHLLHKASRAAVTREQTAGGVIASWDRDIALGRGLFFTSAFPAPLIRQSH